MQFIQGNNRHQTYFSTLDDQVSADNDARLMDAFVEKIDLKKSGFENIVHKNENIPYSKILDLFQASVNKQ